jgi:hypothetical protein
VNRGRDEQPAPARRLAALLLAAAAAAAALSAPGREVDRAALAAVDAEEFARLDGKIPAAAAVLWERLRAMGVGAAFLREETLGDLAARGEIAYFARADVARWRAAGILPASSPLQGGALWARDPRALARAAEALAVAGIDSSSGTLAGTLAVELPPGDDWTSLPAGFDPAAVSALSSAGFLPVAASTSPVVEVAGQRVWTRTLRVDAKPGEVRRAALGRPLRLVVFRARPGAGLEANLDLLRASLRVLREAEPSATLPAARPAAAEDGTESRARVALIWLIGLAGPLLAARAGLAAARAARGPTRLFAPLAAPVPQAAAGLCAAWAVAALAGFAVVGVAPEGWRDGSQRAWTLWTWCAPLVVAAAALFASSAPTRRAWTAPVRRRDLAALAVVALAAALLAAPRAALRASALWESFDRFSAAGVLWWWPWRWREALVGAPSLTLAFALIEERDAADGSPGRAPVLLAEPHVWLLFGLLAPAGLLAAIGAAGEPVGAAVAHGAAAQALGALLGGAIAGLRDLLDRWVPGPMDDRPIDPSTANG